MSFLIGGSKTSPRSHSTVSHRSHKQLQVYRPTAHTSTGGSGTGLSRASSAQPKSSHSGYSGGRGHSVQRDRSGPALAPADYFYNKESKRDFNEQFRPAGVSPRLRGDPKKAYQPNDIQHHAGIAQTVCGDNLSDVFVNDDGYLSDGDDDTILPSYSISNVGSQGSPASSRQGSQYGPPLTSPPRYPRGGSQADSGYGSRVSGQSHSYGPYEPAVNDTPPGEYPQSEYSTQSRQSRQSRQSSQSRQSTRSAHTITISQEPGFAVSDADLAAILAQGRRR